MSAEFKLRHTVHGIACDAAAEVRRAQEIYPPMNSPAEGWAVLYEEVIELFDEIRAKHGTRDIAAMRHEAVQVAAMAIRFIYDICDGDRGQR